MHSDEALPEGKLPIRVLRKMLTDLSASSLVVGPSIGVDVGVSRTRGRFIVSSSDPITGTEHRLGWHAVNVSANDVATSGIMPDTINVVAMFPRSTNASQIKAFMSEINKSAKMLGITVAGGHTEITPGLSKPIAVITAFGSGDRFVTSACAKANDVILMTKTAGIEGTAILAQLKGVARLLQNERKVIDEGVQLLDRMSILKEARTGFATGLVHAMHDVTEGGVLGAVYEMSLASNLGFEVDASKIPLEECTQRICKATQTDPLTLLGSGSLLLSCHKRHAHLVSKAIAESGIRCNEIGRFVALQSVRTLVRGNKRVGLKETSIQDGLWSALQRYP